MSYTSHSELAASTQLNAVLETVTLLGYQKINDGLTVPNRVQAYMWCDNTHYRSWVGVELDVYKAKGKPIIVTTRSRMGRSHWDLLHQNRTLKFLRDLFGGHFETDAGRNRYWRPEGPPPKPIASGCYLARWRFHVALIKPRIYLHQRGLDQQNTRTTGISFVDEMNPRLFSNNLVLPYLVAVWEEYFKASFAAMLRYSPQKEGAIKRIKISHEHLEMIASGTLTIEDAIAESLSFQRPSIISTNFSLIDSKMHLASVLRKPYRKRKISLFEAIEARIEDRNQFVHTGEIDLDFSDEALDRTLKDFEVAIDRCYREFGRVMEFAPILNF